MANTYQPDKTGKRQPLTDKAMHFVDMEILKRRYEWNDDCNCELCSGPEVIKFRLIFDAPTCQSLLF